MTDLRPDLVAEVDDCIRRIKAYLEANGRRIHRHIKRSRKGPDGIRRLERYGVPIPDDFRALYHHYAGIDPPLISQWQTSIFLEFYWSDIESIRLMNRYRRRNPLSAVTDRLLVFTSYTYDHLELAPSLQQDGDTPLVITRAGQSRNFYIAFDSTLAMLRSVCAAQDASIFRYATERGDHKEVGEVIYDPKALWDVIKPFNPRADYWPHLIAGTVEWDMILPKEPEPVISGPPPVLRPELVEEVDDCLARIKAFHQANGRLIHEYILRSNEGADAICELEQFGIPLPADFHALYRHYNGTEPGATPQRIFHAWDKTVFLDFEFRSARDLVYWNKLLAKSKDDPMRDHLFISADRSTSDLRLLYPPTPAGDAPLVVTFGRDSRKTYIAFDSALSMLRSTCAAQEAGILRFPKMDESPAKRRGQLVYDLKELWDVIGPFNPRADYWTSRMAGSVNWGPRAYDPPGDIQTDPHIIEERAEKEQERVYWEKVRARLHKKSMEMLANRKPRPIPEPDRYATTSTTLFDGTVFADYHQIYITDADSDADVSDEWVESAMQTRIFCGKGVLILTTLRDTDVPLRVALHDAQPKIDFDAADHVVLGHLRTRGELVIAGPTDNAAEAPRASVPAGNLRAMVVFKGLGTMGETALDASDSYAVHLWPDSKRKTVVLKQWMDAEFDP